MSELEAAYRSTPLPGKDLAELEIEARRDAHEIKDPRKCPYEKGSFPALCFHHELQKMRLSHGF